MLRQSYPYRVFPTWWGRWAVRVVVDGRWEWRATFRDVWDAAQWAHDLNEELKPYIKRC